MKLTPPYLLFAGDVSDQIGAKSAYAIAYWRPELCVGQLRLPGCKADTGLKDMSIKDAAVAGAKTMIVGTVNVGGTLPEHWYPSIVEALDAGMDVACGLHARLSDIPEIVAAAKRNGRQLHDVRHQKITLPCGTGEKRTGKRLLTVGTDCSVGKMFTALSIHREMVNRGMNADFRATGQTGIMVAGSGICVDAVISDFTSGAAEYVSPANDADHWDIIEGQGSLFHPSASGVTMGLVHGAQADALVLCHEPTRRCMRGLPKQSLPDIRDCLDLHVKAAQLTNPAAHCIGLSINTAAMTEPQALAYLSELEQQFELPVVDPIRTGVGRLVDCLSAEETISHQSMAAEG